MINSITGVAAAAHKFFSDGLAEKGVLPAPVSQVAIIGDSITNPDYNGANKVTPSTPTNILKASNGIITWALTLSGQRVECPTATNVWAFPGQETSTILTNLSAFIAQMPRKPGVVVVECGTNNIYHDAAGTGVGSFASITADWSSIATLLLKLGIRAIFVPILPRGAGFTTLFTAAQFDVMDRCNRWLYQLAQRSLGQIAIASECLPWITDPASVGAQPKSNYTYDGTHPGVTAAYYIGKAVARILSTWFPPLDLLPWSNNEWSAAAPNGNMLGNAMMQGTGGTISAASGGGTNTGAAPAGWTVDAALAAGLTCTNSIVTSAVSGLAMHQMAFTGSHTISGSSGEPTYAYYGRLRRTPSTPGTAALIAGDTIEGLIYFEIDAGQQGLAFPSLQLRWKNSSNFNTDMQPAPREIPNEAIQGVLRTAPHTYTGGEIGAGLSPGDVMLLALAYLKSNPDGETNDNATIRWGRAAIQKVS